MTITEVIKRIQRVQAMERGEAAATAAEDARDGEHGGRSDGRAANSAVNSYLKTEFTAAAGYIVAPCKYNYFYSNGFVQNTRTGKIAYYNIGDFRYFGASAYWRSAQHFKDWTGGANHNGTAADVAAGIHALID